MAKMEKKNGSDRLAEAECLLLMGEELDESWDFEAKELARKYPEEFGWLTEERKHMYDYDPWELD